MGTDVDLSIKKVVWWDIPFETGTTPPWGAALLKNNDTMMVSAGLTVEHLVNAGKYTKYSHG